MEFDLRFLGDGAADVEIALSGVLDAADFSLLSDALRADPRFRAGLRVLVDLSALDTAGASADTIERLSAPIVERDWYFPPAAVAIFAGDAKTLAAARTYRAHLGGSVSNRQIFTGRAEAVAWLEAQAGR